MTNDNIDKLAEESHERRDKIETKLQIIFLIFDYVILLTLEGNNGAIKLYVSRLYVFR